MASFWSKAGDLLKGAGVGFLTGGVPGAVVGGVTSLMGGGKSSGSTATPSVPAAATVDPMTEAYRQKNLGKLDEALYGPNIPKTPSLSTQVKAAPGRITTQAPAAPRLREPEVPSTLRPTEISRVSPQVTTQGMAAPGSVQTELPAARDAMAYVPKEIRPTTKNIGGLQDVAGAAPTSGADLMGAARGAALQNMDYSRDVTGNYGDYVNRNVEAINKALDVQKTRDVEAAMNRAAQRGLQNYGGTDQAIGDITKDYDLRSLQAWNDVMNQAEGFKREDVAANEALKAAQIGQAAGLGGQEFTQALQGAEFGRAGTEADNARRIQEALFGREGETADIANQLQLAELGAGTAGSQNALDLARGEFGRTGRQQDIANALDVAKFNQQNAMTADERALEAARLNQGASQRESELGLEAGQSNIQNLMQAIGMSNEAANTNFANQMAGANFGNTATAQQYNLQRQREQDMMNALQQEYGNQFGQYSGNVANILSALGLGNEAIGSAQKTAATTSAEAARLGAEQAKDQAAREDAANAALIQGLQNSDWLKKLFRGGSSGAFSGSGVR